MAHLGKHSSLKTEFKKGHGFKGGRKEALKRYGLSFKGKITIQKKNALHRGLGHIHLNSREVDGWVGHHIDYNYVIFIPEELHKSVSGHSVIRNRKMDIINDKVYDWFVEYYFRS